MALVEEGRSAEPGEEEGFVALGEDWSRSIGKRVNYKGSVQ
jgi:hypothetical protein